MADHHYDIIICGGGVAGLYLGARLKRAGYNLIVIEKNTLGHGQTLASQGMIHGGQKYALGGGGDHAAAIAAMPSRWDDCLNGYGDVLLNDVAVLGESQIMFPAGNMLSRFSTFAAAWAVRGRTVRLKQKYYPAPVMTGPVYEMHEKVLDVKSLLANLAAQLDDRLVMGDVTEMLPDGQVAVNGVTMQAQVVIFTAGLGNEDALRLLRVDGQQTQRRPLRQVMVKTMEHPVFGHGIVNAPKPRATITSHPYDDGYVWYMGGNIAEQGAKMTAYETIAFARAEMADMFPHVDWAGKSWATHAVDRAEAYNADGHLPPGPVVQQRGRVMVCWPTKLTFAPLLSDKIYERLQQFDIAPSAPTPAPAWPQPGIGQYPWEVATWQTF